MKILFVSPGCFDKGGISRYNRYQLQALRARYGTENIKVLSLLGPDDNSFEGGFDVYWNGHGISAKDKIGLIRRVLSLSLRWRPDVIWLGHVNLSGLGKVASMLCGAQTVLNAYGLEIWSKMRRDAAWGLRAVKYIVADCHNTADYLVTKNIRKPEDLAVIWDCIDTDRFKPASSLPSAVLEKYGIPDPAVHFNILSLGRLSKPDAFYKGYDRLLEVFTALSGEYPHMRLIFAGRGNYREELETMAREKGMGDKVSFTGSVDEDHLATVYQSCHVFSLVTESGEGKGEGIPLTPLEAMACGKPILVGNEDGSREAVIENKNGFVLPPRDLELQKQLFRNYMDDPQLLARQSGAAAELARQYFSYTRFADEMDTFINKKINSPEK